MSVSDIQQSDLILYIYTYILFSTLLNYSLLQDIAKPVCRSKKQQLEPDMEQRTDSKSGKEYVKAVCTSCEMPGQKKHKLESGLLGEISKP